MGGRTLHVDVQMNMLYNLNKQKLIQMEWVDSNKNSAGLGSKNLAAASHKKHTMMLCDNDNKVQPISK